MMARRLSYSLSRTLKELTFNHRVTVNPVLLCRQINKCQIGAHGFCSTARIKNEENSLEPVTPLELPKILAEEIDRELVPTEDYPTYFPPTFNFAAYIDKSETLKKFVELGVDLSKIEKKDGLPQFVLRLDFNRDVKGHLMFLHDLGVPAENMGEILTKNPLFFKNSLDDLETRLYYLRSKKFELEETKTIVMKDPFWLNFSTTRIDRRLGWFQKNFGLTGSDVRFLAIKFPKVITSSLIHVREIVFGIKEEMGFDKDETKVILLAVPKLFMRNKDTLLECFNYVHNVMKFSHDKILQHPQILNARLSRVKNRCEFLKLLGRNQFDEKQPRYISPQALYGASDEDFVVNICESTIEMYDNFLKTL